MDDLSQEGSGLRILIVDDDETDLRAVRRHLRHAYSSATLDEARTASAALKQIASTPYDCLLLDYYLPDAHDLSLVLRIRQLAPTLPIVMFTGRGDEDIAVDLMKAGVADYVPKSSVTSERLAAAVRHALAMAQAAQKQRDADAELRRALAEAEAATAAKSRLLAVISHDLRQPLQVLVSAHNGLKRAVKGQPAYERKLDLATLATRRLIGAVDKIAQIARLQSGAIVPNRQAFAVQSVLLEIAEIGREQARQRRLEFAVSPCEAWVESDPDMLRSILENLVGNAIKYTERGAVSVACRTQESALCVEVRDTGVGIPSDKLGEIFQEYARLESQRSEGLGLGLAIVARQAEMLGHELEVESAVGVGSCFRIKLPLVDRGA